MYAKQRLSALGALTLQKSHLANFREYFKLVQGTWVLPVRVATQQCTIINSFYLSAVVNNATVKMVVNSNFPCGVCVKIPSGYLKV